MNVAMPLICLVAFGLAAADSVPLPVQRQDSRLGPLDLVTIRAIGLDEIPDKPMSIGVNGNIALPLLGQVPAAGLTILELEADLQKRLKKYVRNPSVTVEVTSVHSRPVSVFGAVNSPGVFQLQGAKTIIEVLSMAGGLRPDAGPKVKISRTQSSRVFEPLPGARIDETGEFAVTEIDIKQLLEVENPAQNILLAPNDVVSVPKADTAYVIGAVQKPGGFPLKNENGLSVLSALSLAEGLGKNAAPKKSRILRVRVNSTERDEIPVDIKLILSGKAADIPLRSDDILFVPDSTAKAVSWRMLEAALQVGTGVAIWRVGSAN